MYSKFTVYTDESKADNIRDAVCGIHNVSEKIGYNRQLFVEQKIEEFLNQCIKDWETKQGEV
jgi:hypothetical protein